MASTGRVYQDYPGAAYILPADEEERHRLESQHELIKVLYDGTLLPKAVSIASGWRVLESGTGTGIWVFEAAKVSPSDVQFIGTDISTRLFPTTLSENVSLVQESILAPPKEWTNSFDLVHQRLLMVALRHPEWVTAFQNIYNILNPGGYVVLTEYGRIRDHGPGSASNRLWNAIDEMLQKADMVLECDLRLPALLKEAGFVILEEDTRHASLSKEGGTTADMWRHHTMGFLRALKPKILQTEGLSWQGSEADLDELILAVEAEHRDIPGLTIPVARITARKAT